MVGSDHSPYIDRLRLRLGARYSAHTIRAFLGQSRRFLTALGPKPSYSRQELLDYVDALIRAGYKPQSIQTILAGVRALLDANGIPWPLQRRDLHLGLPEDEPGGPVLHPAEVVNLIRGVHTQPGNGQVAVALSTIFGLRPEEMTRALALGCDGRTLTVQTAKQGRRRQHAILPGLTPYLTFTPQQTSTESLHKVFERLMVGYVRPPQPREGWHAIRRTLVTALLSAGLPEYTLHRWMGWRTIGRTAFLYFRPDPVDVDTAVYALHPFIRPWLEG